jgi:hypothetical protein
MSDVIRMRIVGSILVVVSYFVIIHYDPVVGVIGTFIGDGISLPYFIKVKAYDVVTMLIVMMGISLSGLI